MSTHGLRRRVNRVARVIVPPEDRGTITLVELYRLIWQRDQRIYMDLVRDHNYGAKLLMPAFERQDADVRAFGRKR